MNVVVFLESPVRAFRITPQLVNHLRSAFPAWHFIQALSEEDLVVHLKSCEILITWYFRAEWYGCAPHLKAIFTPSAGKDWIARHPDYSIPLFFGSFHGIIMAESLLAMILYFNRRLSDLISNQRQKIWNRDTLSSTHALSSQHCLIAGFGSIGRECARLLKPFGCKITGIRRTPSDHNPNCHADTVVHPDALPEILPSADHVICILPGTEETRNFFDKNSFSNMKPSAFFYNLGRGHCCNEADLIEALEKGSVAGAGLDVFEEEPLPSTSKLWSMANVLIMPHGSAICNEYLPLFIRELKGKLAAFK